MSKDVHKQHREEVERSRSLAAQYRARAEEHYAIAAREQAAAQAAEELAKAYERVVEGLEALVAREVPAPVPGASAQSATAPVLRDERTIAASPPGVDGEIAFVRVERLEGDRVRETPLLTRATPGKEGESATVRALRFLYARGAAASKDVATALGLPRGTIDIALRRASEKGFAVLENGRYRLAPDVEVREKQD